MVTEQGVRLRVAAMVFGLKQRDGPQTIALPEGHCAFCHDESVCSDVAQADSDSLCLEVLSAPILAPDSGWRAICRTPIWELWQDGAGRDVYTAPRQAPPRQALLAPDYAAGEVRCPANGQQGLYPLQGLDNLILSNWLARRGDVILHAAGVVLGGKGYLFVGPAGAGKSTLAAHLQAAHGATVLGEDQIAMRYLDGRFWVFGTPWHLNAAMCSPAGAPLERLYCLDRTAPQGVAPLSPGRALARLLQAAFIPYYRPEAVEAILERLSALVERMPIASLSYRLGTDALPYVLAT